MDEAEVLEMSEEQFRQRLWDAATAGHGRPIGEDELELLMVWVVKVVDTQDEISISMLASALDGTIDITEIVPEPKFRISMQGKAHVEQLLKTSTDAREQIMQLDAMHGTKTELPPFEGDRP